MALGVTELVEDVLRRVGIAPKARKRKIDGSGGLGSGISNICDEEILAMSQIVVRVVVFRFVRETGTVWTIEASVEILHLLEIWGRKGQCFTPAA